MRVVRSSLVRSTVALLFVAMCSVVPAQRIEAAERPSFWVLTMSCSDYLSLQRNFANKISGKIHDASDAKRFVNATMILGAGLYAGAIITKIPKSDHRQLDMAKLMNLMAEGCRHEPTKMLFQISPTIQHKLRSDNPTMWIGSAVDITCKEESDLFVALFIESVGSRTKDPKIGQLRPDAEKLEKSRRFYQAVDPFFWSLRPKTMKSRTRLGNILQLGVRTTRRLTCQVCWSG